MEKWIEATGRTEKLPCRTPWTSWAWTGTAFLWRFWKRARSGFFGIGGSPAKVKVTYEVPDEAPAPKPPVKAPVAEQPPVRQPAPAPVEAAAAVEEEPLSPEAKAADYETRIRAFLSGLLEQMGVQAEITVGQRTENGIPVTLDGPKLGAVIGHRGETLDAIQQLTNYAVNRGRAHRVRIHIDAENYRAKREESLRRLATKVAAKVVKYRRNVTLEPMNAYERHVIHETLQDYPDVITYSTGTEPNRRTVVAYSRGKHAY